METLGLDELLARAAAAQLHRLENALRPARLTAAQYRCLCAIERRQAMSGAEIARTCNLSPPTVAVVVANLERDGHIERFPNETNRRIQTIVLTKKGAAATREARSLASQVVEAAVGEAIAGIDPNCVRRFLVRVAGPKEF